jgi:DNA-binding XRE family transcriptional regulator
MDSRTTTIGQRIAMIRVHRMMTQAMLAHAIGVSRSVVFHLEHGNTRVGLDLAERIAAALRCAVDDLLARSMRRCRASGSERCARPASRQASTSKLFVWSYAATSCYVLLRAATRCRVMTPMSEATA